MVHRQALAMTRALSTDPACTNTALTRITGEAIEALALSTFRDAQPGPRAGLCGNQNFTVLNSSRCLPRHRRDACSMAWSASGALLDFDTGTGHGLRDVAAVRLRERHGPPPRTFGALELRAVHTTRVLVVVGPALAGPAVALLLAEVAVSYETAIADF